MIELINLLYAFKKKTKLNFDCAMRGLKGEERKQRKQETENEKHTKTNSKATAIAKQLIC
jgi:hypothetical protein